MWCSVGVSWGEQGLGSAEEREQREAHCLKSGGGFFYPLVCLLLSVPHGGLDPHHPISGCA